MDFLKPLLSPEVTASMAELLVAAISLVLTITLPIITARIYRWTGVRIEEKHMKVLHEAISTWAFTAVTRGVNPASREAYEDLLAYLKQSVPDALKALGPSAEVLIGLASRYLRAAAR